MASPLKTAKQSVNLTAPRVPGSRIRRDPPPVAKKIDVRDPEERDRRNAMIGVVAFALAIGILTLAVSSAWGWSPSQYTIHLKNL